MKTNDQRSDLLAPTQHHADDLTRVSSIHCAKDLSHAYEFTPEGMQEQYSYTCRHCGRMVCVETCERHCHNKSRLARHEQLMTWCKRCAGVVCENCAPRTKWSRPAAKLVDLVLRRLYPPDGRPPPRAELSDRKLTDTVRAELKASGTAFKDAPSDTTILRCADRYRR